MSEQEIPTDMATDRNISPKLQAEIDEKRKEAEGLTDEQIYIYIFQFSRCKNFKELMTLMDVMGYTLKRQFTHAEYLGVIPESIRHTCVMRETPENYLKRKEMEKNGENPS